MTGGSDDARTPKDEPNAVDAAWDALLGETGNDDEALGVEDAPPVLGRTTTVSGPTPAHADEEMARLMSGAAPKLPVIEDDSRELGVAETAVAAKPVDVTPVDVKPTLGPKPVDVKPVDVKPTVEVEPIEAKPVDGKPTVGPKPVVVPLPIPTRVRERETEEDHPARASRPVEPSSPPRPSPSPPARGVPWMWIGAGAIALGAVAYAITREDSPGDDRARPRADAAREGPAQTPERDPIAFPPPRPDAGSSDDPEDDDGSTGADPSPDGGTPPKPRAGDPREPPPNTPPEIAAVFRRLPVSPSDRPPVGGIGASGIHIDHIAMGSETTGATCSGRTDDFSVSRRERAGVCVRVVHPREKEELQVLWQKHGGSSRRSKMVVLPMHAYRTRGYLVLRNEYIGDWTVRILSSDGVELASHEFTVVP